MNQIEQEKIAKELFDRIYQMFIKRGTAQQKEAMHFVKMYLNDLVRDLVEKQEMAVKTETLTNYQLQKIGELIDEYNSDSRLSTEVTSTILWKIVCNVTQG